jgi:hypothetical protein
MRTDGVTLYTTMTMDQVDALKETFGKWTPDGLAVPGWLAVLEMAVLWGGQIG